MEIWNYGNMKMQRDYAHAGARWIVPLLSAFLRFGILPSVKRIGVCDMCTMAIPKGVCRKRPVRIVRVRTLDGLPDFIRRQCATHDGARAYLASVGLQRSRNGKLIVIPM